MAPRYSYIPMEALDQADLQQQARDWADQQRKQIAEDWARSNVPDPLAGLGGQDPYLSQLNSSLATPTLAPPALVTPPAPSANRPSVLTPSVDELAPSLGGPVKSVKPGSSLNDISQFGDQTLTEAEAYAACGPAAAVRLASVYGNQIPLRAALDAAKQTNWTAGGGMNGVQNEQNLLTNLGIHTKLDASPTQEKVIADALTGNPVTISTNRHYFTVSGYDAEKGLYVGRSGSDLKGGSEWLSWDSISRLGGGINGALFVNNPNSEMDSPQTKIAQGDLKGALVDYARQAAKKVGIDPDIFVRQINQESGFDPNAGSPAGAQGIAQIVPKWHPGVDTSDPKASLDYAADLMRSHLQHYGGDYSKALAAYNAGAGAVQQYGGVPPFEETQTYVKNILGGAKDQLAKVPGDIAESLFQQGDMNRTTVRQTGEFTTGVNASLEQQQREANPMMKIIPGMGGDPMRAISSGLGAAGMPSAEELGAPQIPTPFGSVPLGPRELIGFAAGMQVPQGPAGKLGAGASKAITKSAGAVAASAGKSTLERTFDMFERNRQMRDPGLLARAGQTLSTLGVNLERQLADRYVDLNRLGHKVEVAVSTYLGRLPGAEQRVKTEFTPLYKALGDGTGQNGRSMIDNFNAFVKHQRDLEVALAKSPQVTQVIPGGVTQTGPTQFTRTQTKVATGPSGLRSASAGSTGASDAQGALIELQESLTPKEWQQLLDADKVRQGALDRLLDDRVASGLLSNEDRQMLLEIYPHYNPTVAMRNVDAEIMRTGGGKRMTQLTNNFRRLMADGIKDDTEEPALSAIRGLMRGDLDIRRNNTVRAIVEDLKTAGKLGRIELSTYPGERAGKLQWYEDGKRLMADVPEEVDRAAKALDDTRLGLAGRIASWSNAPLRTGAVVLSPPFWLVNAAADYITLFIREGGSAAGRVPRMWAEAARQGPLYQELARSGGMMSTLSRTGEHADVEKLIQQSGGLVLKNMPQWQRLLKAANPLNPIRKIGEVIELAPRLATFEAQLERSAPGKGTKALSTLGGPGFGHGSTAEAAMAARRATVDFARSGQLIRTVNPLVLFLNARVQGTLQVGRTLRDNPNSRWRLASVLAPVVAAHAWNVTNFPEEYGDIPDWEKDSFVPVITGHGTKDEKGKFTNIPRISIPLREWAMFTVPFRAVLNKMTGADARNVLQLASDTLQTTGPVSGESATAGVGGLIPAPARTPLELATNQKFFTGAPIEPETMRNLPPSAKYTDRTTNVAQGLSWASRNAPGPFKSTISPTQMDFIIQENLAGLGRFLTGDRINPLSSIYRTSAGQTEQNTFKLMDKQIADMREKVADQTRQDPEFANATKDRQQQMLRQDQIQLEETLKEKYGVEPKEKDYGLPNKYRGVTDPAKQLQIDKAISKYDNWRAELRLRPSERSAPKPTPEEQRLAAVYGRERMRNPTLTRVRQQQRRAQDARAGRVTELARQ